MKKGTPREGRKEDLKSDLEYYCGLVQKSFRMNSREEILGDDRKIQFLLEYMDNLKKCATAYFRAETESILQDQAGGNWLVLPKDRKVFEKELYTVTRTAAVKRIIEKKVIKEQDLEAFYRYCSLIRGQVWKLYVKYFRSRLYRKGDMVCSRICGTWDPKKKFWYVINDGKCRINKGFPEP